MKKVHIALVGGQPVPVYIGIKDNGQASTVILVCSSQSRVEAERIKKQFPKRHIVVKECPPVDLSDIEKLVFALCEEYSDYEKVINLTSGTKLWSLTFFRVFYQDKNTHFIYIDQNNHITDILTKESHIGTINTLNRFELYGTPLTSFRMLEEYDEEDISVSRKIELFRNKNRFEFFQLTAGYNLSVLEKENVLQTERGSVFEYSFEERWARIKLYTDRGFVTKEFSCQHLLDILFNFGWFELKTALELRKNERISKIWLNCEFADSEKNPKNEIDIIAEQDNRLLFVECKTMIYDSTDIDKFGSALRNFSGTSTTGIFVTNDPPNTNRMSRYNHAMEKCKDNGILTFNFSLWRNNPTENPPLNTIINEQIQIQNKR